MHFLQNKYYFWYFSIIEKAKLRILTDTYIEKHHIIPKSLGGKLNKENLVNLTAREHFLCHLFLIKMTTGNDRYKMAWALHRMAFSISKNHKNRFTSKSYELARKLFSKYTTGVLKNNGAKISKALKGKKKSEEHCKNLSLALKGFKFSEERNQKISRAHSGKKRAPFSKEHIQNMSTSKKGKKLGPQTAEHRKKLSEAAKRRKPRKFSEQAKQNMSLAHIGKKRKSKSSDLLIL